jgi:hypothetical protein
MRPRPVLLALVLAAAGALATSASAHGRAPAQCAATFHVLHDDTIGELDVPNGQYRLAVDGVGCAKASLLLTQFLRDFNGVLPRPWRYSVEGAGRGTFMGRGEFTVTRTGDIGSPSATPGSVSQGGGSHGDLQCRGTFDVVHEDRVGRLRIPRGDYRITLLGGNLTCTTAERFFARFLQRPRGRLPRGWVVMPQSAEFMKFSSNHGFRIKAAVG